jgi:hypothetical protein
VIYLGNLTIDIMLKENAMFSLMTFLVSDAGLNGDVSNDEHSISSDVAADLAQDGDSIDSEREALNLVSVAIPLPFCLLRNCYSH